MSARHAVIHGNAIIHV